MAGRDLHVSIDGDDRGFDRAMRQAEESAKGLDRELGRLERQQKLTEFATNRTASAVQRYGRDQDKAALAARKAGDTAATAAARADVAIRRAADAADKLANGEIEAGVAAKRAAEAERAIERSALAAAAAHRAAARAADDQADQERQLAGAGGGMGGVFLRAAAGARNFRSEAMSATASLLNWKTVAVLLANALAGPLAVGAASAAAEMTAAGAAVGAFGLAAAPQLKKASAAAAAYSKAVNTGGKTSKQAAKDMDAYKRSLKGLPPATRDTAVALIRLKGTYQQWSASLAKSTMPIFTRGLNLAREILPKLTPLVRIAAASFDDFLGGIEKGVKGGGFDAFMTTLNHAAAESLPRLLGALKNTVIGVGRLMQAFLPLTSGDFSRGLENMTKKFSDWAGSLRGNPQFEGFVQRMKDALPGILTLLGNLVKIVGNLAVAFGPLSGTTLKAVEKLSGVIAALPVDVLTTIAQEITAIVLATKAWALWQGIANAVAEANPYVRLATVILAVGTAFVIAMRTSQSFRDAVVDGVVYIAEATIRTGEIIVNTLLSAFDGVVQGAAKLAPVFDALGMHGVADNIRQSAKDIDDWKNSIVGSFDRASDSVERWGNRVKSVGQQKIQIKADLKDLNAKLNIAYAKLKTANSKTATAKIKANIADLESKYRQSIVALGKLDKTTATSKMKGHIADLQAKVAAAKRALNTVPKSRRAELKGYIAQLQAQVRAARAALASVHSKTVYINGIYRGMGDAIRASKAKGGLVGYATGGQVTGFPSGGRVGGSGTGTSDSNLIAVSRGEFVVNARDTARNLGLLKAVNSGMFRISKSVSPGMSHRASTSGGGGVMQVNVNLGGKTVASVLIDPLKGEIRKRGGKGPGSVQTALGYS